MKKLATLLFLFFCLIGFAQEPVTLQTAKDATKARYAAIADINKKDIRIHFQGGIAPLTYTTADKEFQKKYKVKFVDMGCVALDKELVVTYNEMMFKYLDSTYGKGWRTEIRQDAIGFKRPVTKTKKTGRINSAVRGKY